MAFAEVKLKHCGCRKELIIFALGIVAIFQPFSLRASAPFVCFDMFSQPKAELDGPVRLVADINAMKPRGTIFTCVSPSFYYMKHFLYVYAGLGYNVRVYEAESVTLHGRKLPIHWCRVLLLAKGYNIGPPPLIYSDADTRVNVTELENWVSPYLHYDGLIIMNGTVDRPHEIRTNWFVLPVPVGHRTTTIIQDWASHAKDVGLQDQFVINELYPRCDDNIGLLCRHYEKVGVTSWHCGSHNRSRPSCMHDTIHLAEKIPKYMKSI
ncbi:unnamed protein product [Agarophyton chilense]